MSKTQPGAEREVFCGMPRQSGRDIDRFQFRLHCGKTSKSILVVFCSEPEGCISTYPEREIRIGNAIVGKKTRKKVIVMFVGGLSAAILYAVLQINVSSAY